MAELVAKKSSNVVSNNSNKKNSDVCSVQSNNGLIDLDNITTSNNQLITLCDDPEDDDDLIMTRNTKNELSPEDKSLQEMIESELALRICSANDDEEDLLDAEDDEASQSQPEVTIKKIILEPRPDPLDINAEFIGAEMEHYTIVEDPYTYRNGHTSPGSGESRSPERPEVVEVESRCEEEFSGPLGMVETAGQPGSLGLVEDLATLLQDTEAVRPEDDVVEDEILVRSEVEPDWSSVETFKTTKTTGDDNEGLPDDEDSSRPPTLLDKHRREENEQPEVAEDDETRVAWAAPEGTENRTDDSLDNVIDETKEKKNLDYPDVWLDREASPEGNGQTGNFSDDFAVSPRREKTPVEPEEPEDDQHREFEEKTSNYNPSIDADEDSKAEADIGFVSENNREIPNESIVEVDPVVEESEKTSDSCPSADSSQIEVLPSVDENERINRIDENISEEIAITRCFIGEECIALVKENHRVTNINDDNGEPEVEDFDGETNDFLVDEDNDIRLEKDVRVFGNESSRSTEAPGLDGEAEETESSWMTVEEATNDRNKLAETMNERKPHEGANETSEECRPASGDDSALGLRTDTETSTTTNTTTNGLADVASEPEINFVATARPANHEHDDSSYNPTKIDYSRAQDSTPTNSSRLTLSNDATVAPLATPDDESSELSNVCYSESREEVITSSSVVTSSTTSTKISTKTKKKKIEGVAGNDASPTLTPRTKKTKKSKKNDLEKENISVCRSFGDISNMTDVDQAGFGISEQTSETQEKSSFNKFDALSKKSVLHVRSADTSKTQQQLNSVGQNGDANPNCRSCGKVVFQMEQTKAEGLVWHKNCFRCVQCSKQLNVDNYQSHESTLYCKAHFKELFQPKPVEESDQPASDKPDLGLEELSSLNVKSRFQVFEKTTNDTMNEIERSPSQVVKRSPSILSKLAKFQSKGMDIGVADDSLNGIPFEESSESEEEEEIEESEELDTEIIKAKRATRERPISFTKMDDIKNRWECTSQQGRRESQREARKEEIAGIRSRLFMGKQGKMKEMYQQAVAESERVTKTNPTEEIQHSTHARSIKERFERGEPIATSDDEIDAKPKQEKPDEEVIAAGISRKSRSLFLELDASAAKTGRPVTPVNPKTPTDVSRRARDQVGSPEREIYRDPDVVRAEDRVDEVVHTDTARKMLSIFRQMEEKATKEDIPDGPKPLKRFTPPPEDKFAKATASESEDEDEEEGEESEGEESGEERDPNYVRASDKVEDEFLKQAQNAARAKTLRAKFEQWETTDGKVTSHHVAEMDMAQGNGDQASIESASSLRARFESLGSQPSDAPRASKVKVNRFVEIQTICMDVCESCQKKVYPLEKVETNNKIFHKQCFRCLQCNCVLRMDTFTLNNGKLYCIPHFKQLFIARGNYDEGFGVDPHKNKWATNNTNPSAAAASTPIAVSNGRATSVANRV